MPQETLTDSQKTSIKWVDQLMKGCNPFSQMTKEKRQEAHTLAYLLYRNQQYQEASHFFRLLAIDDPAEAKYWKGLGACLQMRKSYEEALNCYLTAQMQSSKNPDPYLYTYAADCYFALRQVKNGLKALEAAEKCANPQILKHVAFMRKVWANKEVK